ANAEAIDENVSEIKNSCEEEGLPEGEVDIPQRGAPTLRAVWSAISLQPIPPWRTGPPRWAKAHPARTACCSPKPSVPPGCWEHPPLKEALSVPSRPAAMTCPAPPSS